MFGFNDTSTKENNQRPVQEQFVIIYDKLTKPVAISLRNSIISKYTCAVWDKKYYDSNEAKLTSKNYLIILNEELVIQNLANPRLKQIKYINGIVMLVEGNTLGLKYDSDSSPKKLNDILKGSWNMYLHGALAPILIFGGIPLFVALLSTYLLISDNKKIRLKLFFDAADKLKEESLELFLNGKLG